jgi:chemotaxis protein CheC
MKLDLTEMQLDALREVGNIGASYAATALSEMLGGRVDLSLPGIEIVSMEKFNQILTSDKAGVNYMLTINGEINSVIVLHFSGVTKSILGNYLVSGTAEPAGPIDDETREMMDSAIQEVSNILVSQAADAFSSLLDFKMTPSIPIKMNGGITALDFGPHAEEIHPEAILLDAKLNSSELEVETKFYIVPFKSSVGNLLEKLGVSNL